VQLCFDFYMIEAKPENLIGDRAYDSDPLDEELRWSSFRPNWGLRPFEVVGGKFRWLDTASPPQQGEEEEGPQRKRGNNVDNLSPYPVAALPFWLLVLLMRDTTPPRTS